MTEFKPGDRVSIEATVVRNRPSDRLIGIEIDGVSGDVVFDVNNDRLTLVKRAKPAFKPGQDVEGKDYEQLPIGTYLVGEEGGTLIASGGRWVDQNGIKGRVVDLFNRRTIAYLPEVDE